MKLTWTEAELRALIRDEMAKEEARAAEELEKLYESLVDDSDS